MAIDTAWLWQEGNKSRIGGDGEYDGADGDGGDEVIQKPLKRVQLTPPIPPKDSKKEAFLHLTPSTHFVRVNSNSS